MGFSRPESLAASHDLDPFRCGVAELDNWLKQRALGNESRFSRTYVVCEKKVVVAYVSISAGSIARDAAPGNIRRNAPDAIPIAIVGRLAVSRAYAGHGLGSSLLADAFRRIVSASESIGIGAVLVQAKEEAARQFYLSQAQFIEHPEDSRTLFLPIRAVTAAIGH